jgi:hypothetical protein
MDSDLTPSTSAYFQILKSRRSDLDFLMPQFYNGVTRPAVDGIAGTGSGAMSAAVMFTSLSNDLFASQPNKVSDLFIVDSSMNLMGAAEEIVLIIYSYIVYHRLCLATASLTAAALAPTQMLPRPFKS